jgi:hypothetical protein
MRRLFLISLVLWACGGGGGGPGQGGGSSRGKIRLIPNVIAGTQTGATAGALRVSTSQGALSVGSPAAGNLKSLKYYITSIQLCEGLTIMGSGYSNQEGCIAIYLADMDGAPDYNTYRVTQAAGDTTGGFIDLLTAEGQALLRKPVSLEVPIAPSPGDGGSFGAADAGGGVDVSDAEMPRSKAGVYRYGLINFYRPIKVTGEFPIVGDPTRYYRTRAVTAITPSGPSGPTSGEKVQIGDTLSGPTEETTYMLNNGGALFTFQQPFSITQADIDAKSDIKIDLVFNPANFGQVYPIADCLNSPATAICDSVNGVTIDMPYVRMSPVPRKTGERTRKETYLIDNSAQSKLRVELYYNDADPEASVQGVDAAVVYTAAPEFASNNPLASNFVSQTGSVRTMDASVTLMDYQHAPNLEGLRRRQNGTATFHCLTGGFMCSGAGATLSLPYVFVGDTIVSSD